MDDHTKELIAIGCSVTANCHPCIKYHIKKARELALDDETIRQAILMGQKVRQGAAGEMDKLVQELFETDVDGGTVGSG